MNCAGTTRDGSSVKYFALALPGIGSLLADELREADATSVVSIGGDSRNDVVDFEARGRFDAQQLRLAEDVFVEVTRALGARSARAVAIALVTPQALERGLSVYATSVRPLATRMTYRVIARVTSERNFLRTDLRRELVDVIAAVRPRWRVDDPAAIELWALELDDGFRLGIRLTDASMRHRSGRVEERAGALRPTVAAAMVRLAGQPGGVFIDPCCGSGTIVSEALAIGWRAHASDIDPSAVAATARNAPAALRLGVADVARLPIRDGSVRAIVSNLPFGETHALPAEPKRWLAGVLAECARVLALDGTAVLLAPRDVFGKLSHPSMTGSARADITLLGRSATIWTLRRS